MRAGVLPAERGRWPTVHGEEAAAAAGILGAVAVEMMQEPLGPGRNTPVGIAPYLDTANTALLIITLIGIGVMLWARIDDRRKGLR